MISHPLSLGQLRERTKTYCRLQMDSISKVKVLVAKMVAALRADEARHAMTKDERIRYTLKLRQMQTKLAELEGSGQTASSVQRQGNKRPARASRARVMQVVMTNNNYTRRQRGVKATCLAGNGISFAFGVHSGSVKRALVGLSKGPCSCGASFHVCE